MIQAGEHKAAGQTPLADVKGDIRQELAERKATDKLAKSLDAVQDKISSGMDLAKAAATENMPVHSTDFFAKQVPPVDMGLTDQALGVLFSLKKGETSDTALSTQDGFLLARVSDIQPAGFTPIEQVKDVIKDRLVAQEAQKLARDKAEATAKQMETEDGLKAVLATYKSKIAISKPFTRQGVIPDLGMAPVLVQTAFDTTQPGWFKRAFNLAHASVVAGLEKRIPADPALWEKEKARWVATLTQSKQSELFRSYLQQVQESAKVEMVNDSVLGPKPGSEKAAASQDQVAPEK